MKADFLVATVAMVALQGVLHGQTWTSPDGFLSVAPPDSEAFLAVPSPPPPFVGLWVSRDESARFGLMKMQIPADVQLIQSSAEEGLAEEIGGEVTRLPTRQLAGYEVWHMKAKGASAEITQAMVRNDGTLYKLMAVTVGQAPDETAVNQFIDSLSIAQSKPTASPGTNEPNREPNKDLGGGIDFHDVSKSIGGFGALLAVGLLIYFATRGKKKQPS